MGSLKALGGTSDILPQEARRWQKLEDSARRLFRLYGFEEIRTPLLEESVVFTGSLGPAAEIVTKQMYLFEDRGGRKVALRPEGTASVVRAFIEHGLDKTARLSRFYYIGPMFRAERPQAGRKRQFHQLGVEVFGSGSPYQDAEVMVLLMRLLQELGVAGAALKVNNIGCRNDRPEMLKQLKIYFEARLHDLCDDCKERLKVNTLRIFDCKEEKCRGIAQGSNKPSEWACENCKDHFKKVCETLKMLGVDPEPDEHMVRGLDYYTKTVFEVIHTGLGAQNALGAGGRYDDLVGQMGGASVPAVGFALGLERILMAQEAPQGNDPSPSQRTVFVATVSAAQIPEGLRVAQSLRQEGISVLANLEDRPLKRQLEQASKLCAAGQVLILGEDEVAKKMVTFREMGSGKQEQLSMAEVIKKFR